MPGEKAWAQAPRFRDPTVEGEGPQEVDHAKLKLRFFRTQGRKIWGKRWGWTRVTREVSYPLPADSPERSASTGRNQ